MGIAKTNGQLQLLQDVIRQERIVLSGLRMAELGNQYFRDDVLGCEVSAKLVFEAMGVHHVSFDVNERDGAIAIDLSKPLEIDFRTRFDVVTNFGTSEHVEHSQYWCWRNIHDMCVGPAVMIHAIPEVGSWPRHGHWHYTMDRLVCLAKACDYRMGRIDRHEHWHEDGRQQHSLLATFSFDSWHRRGRFPGEDEFMDIMFPEGELYL